MRRVCGRAVGTQPAEERHERTRVAGLRPAETAGRRTSCEVVSSSKTSPQPSGRDCDVKEQPSARGGCGLLRLQRSRKFKMKNEELKMIFGPQLAKGTLKRTCGTRKAGLRGAKLRPAAPLRAQIQNSKFKIQNYARVAACGEHACSATNCGPPPAEAAARCGSLPEPQIHDSEFKIQNCFRMRLDLYSSSGRSLRSARIFSHELRASAAGRLRPARS